jgi:hypothetical protein
MEIGGAKCQAGGDELPLPRAQCRPDVLRPTFLQGAPRWQPWHSRGGGRERGAEALSTNLPGRATAAPVIHARAAASTVYVFN